MISLQLKPFSINDAWYGKKRPTLEFKTFRINADLELPSDLEIPDGDLFIFFRWGFSSKLSDVDNPCKPFLDCLQKKYGFNDKRVNPLFQEKVLVPKGQEFIQFGIWNASDVVIEIVDTKTQEVVY